MTGIVHLGLGNFHRAHQAVYTAAALAEEDGPWGIMACSSTSHRVADAMRDQDGLYAVVEIAPGHADVVVPAVHTATAVAADDPQRVVDAIAEQAVRIVTLTVTEVGYTYSPSTRGLDTDSPLVRADLAGEPPRTAVGQIARGLQRRAEGHGAPITILSCDNLTANGEHTQRLVREFAEALPTAQREDLLPWLAAKVTFPSTMVDRIVPATTDAHRALVADRLGLRDAAPVPAEPFRMWVLQDRFAAGRPAWERGGALFADDVEAYELLKLRLLNGTHSLIAYLGALDGQATIPEATARPSIEAAARAVLIDEYLPTLVVPAQVNLDQYVDQLFSRWSNSALQHRTSQVGSDGSAKLPQRVTDPALQHLTAGVAAPYLALTVAAYLSCIAPLPGFDPGPHAAAMIDGARGRLAPLAATPASPRGFVQAVFDTGGIFSPELAAQPVFLDRVAELVAVLQRGGVAAAVADAAGGGS